MSQEARVKALLDRYVEHHVMHGERLEAAELCRDEPELLATLESCIRDYERLELTAVRPPAVAGGQVVSHYRVLGRIGEGGMGVVYRAEDLRLQRTVALKFLSAELGDDPEAKQRFLREARAASSLDHPNICTVFEIDETDDERLFVAMAYYDGETLRERIGREPLPVAEALDLAIQMAEGLAAAHGKGIVHRDVKPGNLMVTAEGVVKVLDFGLARVAGITDLTRSGTTVGTVSYMSPEQVLGRGVDPRSDLWSLGVVLVEMLTGEPPFAGDSSPAVMHAILHDEPRGMDRVPEALAGIATRALEKRRELRYASAAELVEDLRAGAARPRSAVTLDEEGLYPGFGGGTVVRTLLLTDLVDRTALIERLGDARAGEVFARCDRAARELLAPHDGLEIDETEGFVLLFERPIDAVGYVLAYHRALLELSQELGLELRGRAGIHLGEVVLRRNTPEEVARGAKPIEAEGLAKPTAAEVMALARGGQTLLTQAAFDLARRAAVGGRGDEELEWLAHGSYVFQGLEDPLEIFEVGVADLSPLVRPPDTDRGRRSISADDELTLGWRPAAGLPVPGREHWRLESQIGEGGYGEVWLAAHPKTREKRIFKFCFDAERVRGLKREVVLVRLLKETLGNRDDIVRILEWQFDEPPYFLESEYTAGGDLEAWAEEQGGLTEVDLATRLELVAQAAEALGAAHSVGVLHKDVKPSNILIREAEAGPRASLTDFGIGLVTSREALEAGGITVAGLTQTLLSGGSSSQTGTRLYMAPEVIEGKLPTTLSDVYSLGVVLYQMVLGNFARTVAPGWEREIGDELLREDIAACADGNPARRLASAGELAARLRRLEERRAERAERERLQRDAERARRRRRLFTLASAAGLLVTLAVAFVAWREAGLRQESEAARREAEAAQYVMSIQLAASRLADGSPSLAREALLEAPEALRGWEWGYLVDRAWPPKKEVETVTPGESASSIWNRAQAAVVAEFSAGERPPANGVGFLADGKRLFSVSMDEAAIWDLTAPEPVASSRTPVSHWSSVASHDGRLIASLADETGTLLVSATGEVLHRLPLLGTATGLGSSGWFSADDSLLVTSSREGIVQVWETSTGKELHRLTETERGFPIGNVSFRARGSRLLVPSRDQTVIELDLESGNVVDRIQGPPFGDYFPLYVSPDGRHVVNVSRREADQLWSGHPTITSSTPFVWSTTSGKPLYPLPLLTGRAWVGVHFSQDGTVLASKYRDGALDLLDAETGERLTLLDGYFEAGLGADWSPDGSRLAIGQLDGNVVVLAAADSGPARDRLDGHEDMVLWAEWSRDSSLLATVSYDHNVVIWDIADRQPMVTLPHPEPPLYAAFSSDLELLATYSTTHYRLWEIAGREVRRSVHSPLPLGDIRETGFRVLTNSWNPHPFSRDDRQYLVAGEVIDTSSGETVERLGGADEEIFLAFSGSRGDRIVTIAFGDNVSVWDAASNRRLCRLGWDEVAEAWLFRLSPDGTRLVGALKQGSLRVWDVDSGSLFLEIPAHTSPTRVRFDATGERLVSASWDQTAKTWDAATGELLATFTGHNETVSDAHFSPDGTRLLTHGLDSTARVWDLEGHELLSFSTGGFLHQARWSPDGRFISIPAEDGSVHLHETIPWSELATIGEETHSFEELVRRWREMRASRPKR